MKTDNLPYTRSERVGDELRSIIANIFISEIHIPEAGLLTITNVKVADDLKIAKIYISFLKNNKTVDELMHNIIGKKKLIRHFIGREMQLRYIPELRFYYDDTMEHADKIDKLIYKIHHND